MVLFTVRLGVRLPFNQPASTYPEPLRGHPEFGVGSQAVWEETYFSSERLGSWKDGTNAR